MEHLPAAGKPGSTPRPGCASRRAAGILLLAILVPCCTKGAPGILYPSTHFLLCTEEQPAAARTLEAEARDFLHQAGEYLQLPPPPGGLLRIYHFRRRINLWRHLNGSAPDLRWRKAACYETPECYVIALSGRPSSTRFQKNLRHELSHYLLAAHFSSMPPWLDEGLGEVIASGPPFPRHGPGRARTAHPETTRDDPGACLDLMRLQPGTLLDPAQYRLSRDLVRFLLQHSEDAVQRLHCYLEAARPATSPEQDFFPCWGLSMEEACLAALPWAGP